MNFNCVFVEIVFQDVLFYVVSNKVEEAKKKLLQSENRKFRIYVPDEKFKVTRGNIFATHMTIYFRHTETLNWLCFISGRQPIKCKLKTFSYD